MPNIKSAKKRVLVTEKKNSINRSVKSEIATAKKKFLAAVENKQVEANFQNRLQLGQSYRTCQQSENLCGSDDHIPGFQLLPYRRRQLYRIPPQQSGQCAFR